MQPRCVEVWAGAIKVYQALSDPSNTMVILMLVSCKPQCLPFAPSLHPQLSKEEGLLDFSAHDAQVLHNKVRAFAGWPGTSARFTLQDEATGGTQQGRNKGRKGLC